MTKLQRELILKFEIGKLSVRNELLDTVIEVNDEEIDDESITDNNVVQVHETAQVGQVEVEHNIEEQNVEEQNVQDEPNSRVGSDQDDINTSLSCLFKRKSMCSDDEFQSRLSSPKIEFKSFHLSTLSLNQNLISWQDIDVLAASLPQLQDLQLGGNELSQLGEFKFPHLKSLNLENNLISDWRGQINKLSDSLPSLETLYLNDNELKLIDIPANNMFPHLAVLRIERNSIENWKRMDKELEAAHVVGRIKNLSNVDGNTLTNRERVDLERYYIILCAKEGSTHEEIAAKHPRYAELCAEHGQPDLKSSNSASSTALKDRLIDITLTTRNVASVDELMLITQKKDLPVISTSASKKLLRTMTIRNLKHMIQKLLKIPAAKQQLILLQSIENNCDRDVMIMDVMDDLRDLKFYGINHGDELLVVNL
ncbi:hypothetical protein [Parasitella parasitica]|uniref:Ubiquitin-like domain-containing protein n=1 Tax=Parasitella parasitica TaxID=35722 RepID=A0A0B7N8M3_9FUNG|nr:hypothetical protein [Parasitella parasitica]